MSTELTIYVPAIPIAQPRQRHRGFVSGGRVITQNYTPAKAPVQAFKATVRMAASEAYQGPPLQGPLRVEAECVFPRTKGQTWKRRLMPRLWHVKKPDAENVYKAILDALSGQLFVDDCQVCEVGIRKCIASGDEQPHVVIRVSELTEVVPATAGEE